MQVNGRNAIVSAGMVFPDINFIDTSDLELVCVCACAHSISFGIKFLQGRHRAEKYN